ncbi:MAG: hypothetical protein IPP71_15850 [Bacteroidetes bacterium]|nr:hypothetical protein [Bacteroidota bacterium]
MCGNILSIDYNKNNSANSVSRMTRFLPGSLFLLICFPLLISAQEKIANDSLKAHKVMIIPYDPRYYLSDADRDILEHSTLDATTFRSNFRHNIDRHVQRSIGAGYQCISLLNDTVDAYEETLYKVLGRTGYRYEKAIPITPKPSAETKTVLKSKMRIPKITRIQKRLLNIYPLKKTLCTCKLSSLIRRHFLKNYTNSTKPIYLFL